MSIKNPTIDISTWDDVVRDQLTKDSYYRRNMRWPLELWDESNENPTFNLDEIENGDMNIGTLISPHYKKDDLPTQSDMIESLVGYYPAASIILDRYPGKLAICGGAFSTLMDTDRPFSNLIPADLDFFFYNCTIEEANIILADCVSFICSFDHLPSIVKSNSIYRTGNYIVRIERQEHITTVVISFDQNAYKSIELKYQFIHRIYPRLDTIIGGFDMGPCMVAYDGMNILMTPLGAFCIRNKCLIVDTTRRSTSFNHRIVKYYERGFAAVFPGLAHSTVTPSSAKSLKDKIYQVTLLMDKLGLTLVGGGYSDYYNNYNHPGVYIDESAIDLFLNEEIHIRSSYNAITRYYKAPIDRSDYSDVNIKFWQIKFANGAALRNGTSGGVIAFHLFTNPKEIEYDQAFAIFSNLLVHPKIEDDLSNYKKRAMSYRVYKYHAIYYRTLRNIYAEFHKDVLPYFEDSTMYGRFKVISKRHKNKIEDIANKLIDRMIKTKNIAYINLCGTNWMVENPQRQWTSSFNPIMENPREFYGKYYVPFLIGIPEDIETTLRLIRLRQNNPISLLSKDVFNLILSILFLNWRN